MFKALSAAALAAGLSLPTAATAASLHCQSDSATFVSLTIPDIDRLESAFEGISGAVRDNFLGGALLCNGDELSDLQCVGLWDSWGGEDRAIELAFHHQDGAIVSATLVRSEVYGGAPVTLSCALENNHPAPR
jgi:hypothetical protein